MSSSPRLSLLHLWSHQQQVAFHDGRGANASVVAPTMRSAQPSAPIPAASVIVLAGDNEPSSLSSPPRVLLIKRTAGMKFLPDVYVFPGGKVDDGDRHPSAGTSNPCMAAALREMKEEVGLTLTSLLPDRGAMQALDSLVPFAHWVTPVQERRRYDTWFFTLHVPSSVVTRCQLTLQPGEVADAKWVTPLEAMQLHAASRDNGFKLAPPTYTLLHQLAHSTFPLPRRSMADIPCVEPVARVDAVRQTFALHVPQHAVPFMPPGRHEMPGWIDDRRTSWILVVEEAVLRSKL